MPLFRTVRNNNNKINKNTKDPGEKNSIFQACFEKKRQIKEIFNTIHPFYTTHKKKIFSDLRYFLATKTIVRKGFLLSNANKISTKAKNQFSKYYLSLNYKEQTFYPRKKTVGSRFFSFTQKVFRKKKNFLNFGFKKNKIEKKEVNFDKMGKILWSFVVKAFHKGCDFYEVDKFFGESRIKRLVGKDFFSMFIVATFTREKFLVEKERKCSFHKQHRRFCVHFKYSLQKKYIPGNPCSSCPAITECHSQGIVNPFDCIFLKYATISLTKSFFF
mmetsp:Transcript_55796/g.132435  ORF Transcript_55796/g.132435 Transcript_55796/m.132435 type:complete len:273 (-) Transcript_55796:20-838(-)